MPLLDWSLMYACRMVSRLWHGGALSHRVSHLGDWRVAVLRCSSLLRRACAPDCEVLIGDPGQGLGDAQVAGPSSPECHFLGRDLDHMRLICREWDVIITLFAPHGRAQSSGHGDG